MSLRLMASACLLAALALSQPANAQQPTLRGPWLGAGIGTASASVNCDICSDDRNGGFSGFLTGGLTLSPSVRLGAELNGWFDSTDEISQRTLLYGASAYWNPSPGSQWFLKGGAGSPQLPRGRCVRRGRRPARRERGRASDRSRLRIPGEPAVPDLAVREPAGVHQRQSDER